MFILMWQLHPQSYGKSKRGRAGIDHLTPGAAQEGAGQQPDRMALEGSRHVMAEGSKVNVSTQRRGKESNNPRSMRSQIGACAMQEAGRAAAVESCAAEKEQPCKDRGQKEDTLSSLLFRLSVI